MLKNIKSAHWTVGGTGISNFGTSSDTERDKLAPIYFEAIKRHGNEQYVVSMHTLTGSPSRNGYSLHYLGAKMADNSRFFQIANTVEKEKREQEAERARIAAWLKPEVGELRMICGKTVKVTRTGERFVIETDIGIENVSLKFTGGLR